MSRQAVAVLAASVIVLLAGCATAPAPSQTLPIPETTAAATTQTVTVSPTADAAAGPPTCETLTVAQTVADFQGLGLVATPEPFMIGATMIEGGLTCKWASPNGTGEQLQIFGWAPIARAEAEAARAELLANGWRVIDTDEGLFVTESSDTVFATGDQGYGLTYEFGDDWVTYADTKQNLLLIQRPEA